MTFERSPEGQTNRALFLGVDFTVYVEGGDEDAEFDEGFDLAFWQRAISAVQHGISLRVIPKGGKTNLLALAQDVVANDVRRTIVAMDSDYDDWLGGKVADPRIVYTYGYSFENDIFDRDGMIETFFALCPLCRSQVGVTASIDSLIMSFRKSFRWPHRADIYCVKFRREGLSRQKAQKYLSSNAYGVIPEACQDRLAADVIRMSAAIRGQSGLQVWNSFDIRNAVGHIWEVWAFRSITYLQTLFSRMPKFTYQAVRAAAIATFGARLQSPSNTPILSFYRMQIDAAVAAAR